MLIQNIQEASLIRANYILSQVTNENTLKYCHQELNSLSKLLGYEFDKGIYSLIFDQVDFKDPKLFTSTNSFKYQYFLEIFPKDIKQEKFVNFFAEILMRTRNNNKAQEKLENMAKIIVETAKEKGSEDNISCIVIELNKKLHMNK